MSPDKKIAKVMGEYKEGTLHSGKGGPVVKDRKQAIAIAMSESDRMSKRKRRGGLMDNATLKD